MRIDGQLRRRQGRDETTAPPRGELPPLEQRLPSEPRKLQFSEAREPGMHGGQLRLLMAKAKDGPAALRILFFWRGEWQLQSEWFEWSLER